MKKNTSENEVVYFINKMIKLGFDLPINTREANDNTLEAVSKSDNIPNELLLDAVRVGQKFTMGYDHSMGLAECDDPAFVQSLVLASMSMDETISDVKKKLAGDLLPI